MKFCSHCGKELMQDTIVCPHCGCAVGKMPRGMIDKINPAWCILSLLFPLFGVFYWGFRYDTTPKRARACAIAALIGVILSVLFVMIAILIAILIGTVLPEYMQANNLEFVWS